MEFLSLSRRRSSSRNVPNGEERGETDVFAGYVIDEFRIPSRHPIELWFVLEVSIVSSAYKSILDEVM